MKEASGNLSQIMEILRQKPEGFDVLSGDDGLTLSMISLGAQGVISVVANAFPKKFSAMVDAAMKDELNIARPIHFDLLPVTDMFFEEGNPGGVKVALDELNIMKPIMRAPLYPVSSGLETRIKAETKRLIH